MKSRAAHRLGLHPDSPALLLENPLTDREADPRSLVLAAPMQPLKNHEDALEVLRIDADPVIGDGENPLRLRRPP